MKQLKSLFGDIARWLRSLSGKKIAVIIPVAAVIIAPSVLAGAYVLYYDFLQTDDYFSISLYDSDGNIIAKESELPENAGKSTLTDIFYELTSNPTSLKEEPSNSVDSTYVRAEIEYNGTASEITCYFSTDTAEGYFTDLNGKEHIIPKEINSKFLSTPYAETFYSTSSVFELSSIDHDVITPKSVEWNYKNAEGQYMTASRNTVTEKIKTYEITGAIDIAFEKQPDTMRVRVYGDNKLIYTGSSSAALSSLTADPNDELRVYMEAEWQMSDDADNYGNVIYEFYVRIKNRSTFSVSSETVTAGGFIVLDCTNVTDIQKIKFSSAREDYSPKFIRFNDLTRTVIPFSEDTAEELFDFTVSYGAASESFSIRILPAKSKQYSSDTLTFDDESYPELRSQQIRAAIFNTSLPTNEFVYFQGNFSDPSENGYSTASTHNTTVLWGEALENSFVTVGNEYISASETVNGSSVRALQNGIVAYIGNNDSLGNFVVLDHGCGLRTWYAGLERIDAEVGDLLLAGQHIGKSAVSDHEGQEGFTLYCTVYDTMIDPNTLWDQ